MLPSKGQYYFNERNTVHSFTSLFTSVVQLNGKYYCTGIGVDSIKLDTAYYGVKFVVFDNVGNKIKDTVFLMPYKNIYTWGNNLQVTKDGNLLLAAYDIDKDINNRALIIKFDTAGHALWYKEYDQPFCNSVKWYQTYDLKATGTGEWIMLLDNGCNPPALRNSFVLTKLDSNFNLMWVKSINPYGPSDDPYHILIDNDGNYILAGCWTDAVYNIQSSYLYRGELIKTDTAGNIVWVWRSDSTREMFTIQDVIRTKDSGYVYCGTIGYQDVSSGFSELYWKGWIEKLDKNRNVLWNDSISYLYSNIDFEQKVLKELPDGDIVMAGTMIGGFDTALTAVPGLENYATLIKYSPNGIRKWRRHYQIPIDSFQYRVYDMKQTADKGYVLVGDANNLTPNRISPVDRSWIIKVDSNGCNSPTDPQCQPVSTTNWQLPNVYVNVYPNPAHDIVNIRTTELQNAQVIITDMAGRICMQQAFSNNTYMQSIRITSLPSGMYFYKIMQAGLAIAIGKLVKQ